jgi:hypothetical protein
MGVSQIFSRLLPVNGMAVFAAVSIGTLGCQQAPSSADADADGSPTVADVIQGNSEVIDELGRAAAMMAECTDIIMRYGHFTDDHSTTVLMCPECGQGNRYEDEELVIDDPPENVPETMEQLLRDTRELKNSVAGLTLGLKLQLVTLKRHLEHLREAAP